MAKKNTHLAAGRGEEEEVEREGGEGAGRGKGEEHAVQWGVAAPPPQMGVA